MNTCWKCGRTLPGSETECDGDCGSSATQPQIQIITPATHPQDYVQIDFTKVKTVDDALLVMSVLFSEVLIHRTSRHAHFLKRYLKDNSTPGAETNPS